MAGDRATATLWRRNLAALWTAQFVAIFGFSFVLPFLPLYLTLDLGVTTDSALAFWSGVVAGAAGFSQAVANPIWGLVGDRFGRKSMLVRAMVAGGAVIVLTGLVRDPTQLFIVRVLFGALAGSAAAANALVVSETPPIEVGRALGLLTSAIAMGRTLGPLVGGALAAIFPLRTVFVGAGAVVMVAVVVVTFGAHESAQQPGTQRPSFAAAIGTARTEAHRVFTAIAAVGACQFAYGATLAMTVLRFMKLDPTHLQILVGIAFAAGGLSATVASTTYWLAVRRLGYRRLAVAGGIVLGVAAAFTAVAPSPVALIAGIATVSLAYGATNPTLVSMIGLEAPAAIRGTIMGLCQTATALGMALGPLIAGAITSYYGPGTGLLAGGVAAVSGAAIVHRWAREPQPSTALVA